MNPLNALSADRAPAPEELDAYIASPLWRSFRAFVEQSYGARPLIQYSKCSMEPGWNLKYRKGGKAICTVYPRSGYFTCLVSAGGKKQREAELVLSGCDPYLQALYRSARPFNGSRWLMIDVSTQQILEDTQRLIRVRMA